MNVRLVRKALRRALKKPAKFPILWSDRDEMRSYDFYTVYLIEGSVKKFYVKELEEDVLKGVWRWDDQSGDAYPACIKADALSGFDLRIYHHYGESEIVYKTIREFLWKDPWYARLNLLVHKISKWQYDRKEIIIADRYDLLRFAAENTADRWDYRFSVYHYMNQRYGEGWATHPSGDRVTSWNELLAQSLVETGDLREADGGYRLSAKAFATLSDYELAERRHEDSVRQQRALAKLTYALVIVGLIQVMVAFLN
jgi:hypothetical protein